MNGWDWKTHGNVFDCGSLFYDDLKEGEPRPLYQHEYDGYIALFQMLATVSKRVHLVNCPASWSPMVQYLGHPEPRVALREELHWEAETVNWLDAYEGQTNWHGRRRIVEIAASARPELIQALFLADTSWPCLRAEKPPDANGGHGFPRGFLVTSNASFFRPEIRQFQKELRAFTPVKRKAVIVPCVADKPYPAPFHDRVQDAIGDSWHIITATGVYGLVPQELWERMPPYDAGLPNLWRVMETVAWYFSKHQYDAVVVYSDFYSWAIRKGMEDVLNEPRAINYVMGSHYRTTYDNLEFEELLHVLERAVAEMDRPKERTWPYPNFGVKQLTEEK